MRIKPTSRSLSILLAIALALCIFYIFIYPRIANLFLEKAKVQVITNLINQLSAQGFVVIRVNDQIIKLYPEVVK